LFKRLALIVLASLFTSAAVAAPITIAGGPSGAGLDGEVGEWSDYEIAMTSSCLEDLTPGEFDGYQIGASTRTRVVLQYPGFGGDPLPIDVTEPTGYDLTESDEIEVGCDYVASDPDLPAPNTAAYLTTLRVTSASGPPPVYIPVSGGQFRIPCDWSHFANDDPIVFPNSPGASHLHMFFGNTSTNAYSTAASLSAANSTTCAGGTANESAYWIPAMLDENGDPVPASVVVYYKLGHNSSQIPGLAATTVWPPSGLMQLVGWANATGPSDPHFPWEAVHRFQCFDEFGEQGEYGLYIPECPHPGGEIQGILNYKGCWDGVNLDSTNHRSHITDMPPYEACPPSHPVMLPQVSLNIHWVIPEGQNTGNWKLASDLAYTPGYETGGYSMHGDVIFNWSDPTIVEGGQTVPQTILTQCLHGFLDCHAYWISMSQMLF
jgi:hypothetical protein